MSAQPRKWRSWRRKLITPELVEELAGYFRQGATPKVAAGRIGVPPGVLRGWLREGEQQIEELYSKDTGYPEQEGLLYQACAEATASYLMEHIELVSDPEGRDWRASSWLLERRDDEFNPAAKVEVTGSEGGPIQVEGRSIVGIADIVKWYLETGNGHLIGLEPNGGALPGADPVLPDRPQLERAAGEPAAVSGS